MKEDPLTFGALSALKHLLPRLAFFLQTIRISRSSTNLCFLWFISRLSEAWHAKRPLLVEAVKNLLDERDLAVRKALSEVVSQQQSMNMFMYNIMGYTFHDCLRLQLIVVMASHCYLVGPAGELFVEYLVRHCAVTDLNGTDIESSKDFIKSTGSFNPFMYKKSEVGCLLRMTGSQFGCI